MVGCTVELESSTGVSLVGKARIFLVLLGTRAVVECLRGKAQKEVVETTTVATQYLFPVFFWRRSQRSTRCWVLFVPSCELLLEPLLERWRRLIKLSHNFNNE